MTSRIWSLPGQKDCGPDKLLSDEFPLSELCHRRNSTPGPLTSAVDLDIAYPGGALTPLHTAVDGGGCCPVALDGASGRCWPGAHTGCSVAPEPRCLCDCAGSTREADHFLLHWPLHPDLCWPGRQQVTAPGSSNGLSPSSLKRGTQG